MKKYKVIIFWSLLLLYIVRSLPWDFCKKETIKNYKIILSDHPKTRYLEKNNNAVIGNYIFQIGFSKDYIIVKQHPEREEFGKGEIDTSITNFFILKMTPDSIEQENIVGPLTRVVFFELLKSLKIEDISFDIKYNVERELRGCIYLPPKMKIESEYDTIFRKLQELNKL